MQKIFNIILTTLLITAGIALHLYARAASGNAETIRDLKRGNTILENNFRELQKINLANIGTIRNIQRELSDKEQDYRGYEAARQSDIEARERIGKELRDITENLDRDDYHIRRAEEANRKIKEILLLGSD